MREACRTETREELQRRYVTELTTCSPSYLPTPVNPPDCCCTQANQKVPDELLKFGTHVKKKESKLYGAHFKDVDVSAKATKVKFDSDDDD